MSQAILRIACINGTVRIDETVSGRCREMELAESKRPGYNSIKLPNIQEIVTSEEAAGLIYHRSSNGTCEKLFHVIHRSEKQGRI